MIKWFVVFNWFVNVKATIIIKLFNNLLHGYFLLSPLVVLPPLNLCCVSWHFKWMITDNDIYGRPRYLAVEKAFVFASIVGLFGFSREGNSAWWPFLGAAACCSLYFALTPPNLVPAPRLILKALPSILWCNLCIDAFLDVGEVLFTAWCVAGYVRTGLIVAPSVVPSASSLPSLSSPVPPLISSIHGSASRVHLVLYIGVLGRRLFCFIGPVCFFVPSSLWLCPGSLSPFFSHRFPFTPLCNSSDF